MLWIFGFLAVCLLVLTAIFGGVGGITVVLLGLTVVIGLGIFVYLLRADRSRVRRE